MAGFFHEQSRPDRDEFVRIVEENLDPAMVDNFEKFHSLVADTLDLPYDLGSVMHYSSNAFSKNGLVNLGSYASVCIVGSVFIHIHSKAGIVLFFGTHSGKFHVIGSNFSSSQIQNHDGWVRSTNASSVLCYYHNNNVMFKSSFTKNGRIFRSCHLMFLWHLTNCLL